MNKVKKFFRDLFIGAGSFYFPIILLEIFYLSLGLQERGWAYFSTSILSAAISLVFFCRLVISDKAPSPLAFLLGAWIFGPGSFIAGAYIGYLGGLLFLTFFYFVLCLCRLTRLKITLGTGIAAFIISFFILLLMFYAAPAKYDLSKNLLFRSLLIRDVTQAETLTLVARQNEKNVYRIHVIAEGELDGKALVRTANSKNIIKSQEIGPGKFRTTLGGDWYEPVCFLGYEPETVRSGHVIIYYTFDSLDSNKSVGDVK